MGLWYRHGTESLLARVLGNDKVLSYFKSGRIR
jgi:hypothetical protein